MNNDISRALVIMLPNDTYLYYIQVKWSILILYIKN